MQLRTHLSLLAVAGLLAACATTGSNTSSNSGGSTSRSAESGKATPTTTASSKSGKDDVATHKVMSKDGDFEGEMIGTPAANSKFTKLKIGMSRKQVEDLIGTASDWRYYQTGKAWIPIGGLISKDTYRIETFYKKEGRLVYSHNGGKLFRIHVDTNEDGYQ
ncbi:hypothetical protein [Parachitinimonas caeni]|uniref:Lipoprotein SmpA/OmlA domain-containing protein n=1 Tax=Parachitinimonas caeni TaxID=3031301 RepID=A0ABT7E5Q5_9NEIS|nr:hypothetical protein [Parachitinimonas caeni]MDK2126790.1 hypothetical protein [Parachitinimonas caeni]